MEAKWFNVNEDARIWSGHSDAHKQGWLYAPGGILAIEEYKGSYRFVDWKVGPGGSGAFAGGDFASDTGYPETWIRILDVSLDEFDDGSGNGDDGDVPPPEDEVWPPPEDINVADARLGHAVRLIRAEGGGVVFPASD